MKVFCLNNRMSQLMYVIYLKYTELTLTLERKSWRFCTQPRRLKLFAYDNPAQETKSQVPAQSYRV